MLEFLSQLASANAERAQIDETRRKRIARRESRERRRRRRQESATMGSAPGLDEQPMTRDAMSDDFAVIDFEEEAQPPVEELQNQASDPRDFVFHDDMPILDVDIGNDAHEWRGNEV